MKQQMKRRARRVTTAVAVLGIAVLAVLVVAHHGTIRDHVAAWRIQVTRRTRIIEPIPAFRGRPVDLGGELFSLGEIKTMGLLKLLGNHSGTHVVFDPDLHELLPPTIPRDGEGRRATSHLAARILEASDYRVLERFPRGRMSSAATSVTLSRTWQSGKRPHRRSPGG